MTKPNPQNRYTAETPDHVMMELEVENYVGQYGHRVPGLVLHHSKPRTQDKGAVATLTNVWAGRASRAGCEDAWPVLISVECRRDQDGRYAMKAGPRPRIDECKQPLPVDDQLAMAAQRVADHMSAYLGLGNRADRAHVPARAPAVRRELPWQRKARLAAEATAAAQAKVDDLLDLFGPLGLGGDNEGK